MNKQTQTPPVSQQQQASLPEDQQPPRTAPHSTARDTGKGKPGPEISDWASI